MCLLIVTAVQGDSVSESRFSVLPRDDDQSEIFSVSTIGIGTGGSEQEALSQSQPSQRGSVSGSLQHFQRLPELNSGNGKTLLDRKRKERHESTSQGQEKKVIRSVSEDESLIDSDKSVDFRRTQSHGSFNPGKDHNLLLGYTIEMVHKLFRRNLFAQLSNVRTMYTCFIESIRADTDILFFSFSRESQLVRTWLSWPSGNQRMTYPRSWFEMMEVLLSPLETFMLVPNLSLML